MFGWFKKRLLGRMLGLTEVAQMATFSELFRHFSDTAMPEDQCAAKAAAAANYLFGREPNPTHAQQFDMNAVQAEIRVWLAANNSFRELVVQSLRVANTVSHAASGGSSVIGEPLLSAFGSEFPDAPDPQTYEKLVHRTIEQLPAKEQTSVRSWMKRTGR